MPAEPKTPLLADRTFSPQDLAAWCGGRWENEPERIRGVVNDSRVIRQDNLYVALPGATVDGHVFVAQALQAGAAGALVRAGWQPATKGGVLPLLRVPSTLQALMDLGRGYRRAVAPFMIGVTGSVGKSTVKTWTAALLATTQPTAATCGNYNTDIGLPLSLLQMAPETRLGVFELGISHPGELHPLCRVLEPEAAIISAIGPVHLEFFGTVEAIADEKAELLRRLPASGFAVLDAGSPWFNYLRDQTRARLVTVSLANGDADYLATDVDASTGTFCLRGPAVDQPRRMQLGLPGHHNALNALLAIAAARTCEIPWDAIEAALPRLPRMAMRWEQSDWQGITLINDAYNANPLSMEAAIQTFARVAVGHRRLLVLGEMRELGPGAATFHAAGGACVAASGCEALIAVGPAGGWIADAAEQHGFAGTIIRVEDASGAGEAMASLAVPGDWILLKASRGVHLEKAMETQRGAWRSAKRGGSQR
jgi:UDP-N-acetylmuramoyl-tripeptide--D-alanyl-D-alanine ligase